VLARQRVPDHPYRIVEAVHDALLERDDRVVRDVDAFRAHLAAALRDVAESDARRVLHEAHPVLAVDRMHLERRDAHEEPWPGELVLELVRAQHVADVLAEEAFDALPELLGSIDVALLPS